MYVEMLIWVVYLLCKKYYLISYCIFIKDAYCMILKNGLNFLKIMDFNYKNFKSIVMYCILIFILIYFLLFCRIWNSILKELLLSVENLRICLNEEKFFFSCFWISFFFKEGVEFKFLFEVEY